MAGTAGGRATPVPSGRVTTAAVGVTRCPPAARWPAGPAAARRRRPAGGSARRAAPRRPRSTSTSASESSPPMRAQQEVVHGLVHAAALGDEPEVDGAQRRDDLADDAGLLGDLAHGGVLGGLALLDVALGQRPQQPPAPVECGRSGRPRRSAVVVHDQAARRRSRRPGAAGGRRSTGGPRGARRSDRGRWTCGDGNDAATAWPATVAGAPPAEQQCALTSGRLAGARPP